ncbi:aquaporin-like protein [Bombardia bombarda]|uniref:Aquaporin-like protein n=1 Tax=Bombardia bombarda TaxID=252184 RepID=A0AA39WCE4_9PEZI|nr:aquaporin-like protein [Bombardia bombarda]
MRPSKFRFLSSTSAVSGASSQGSQPIHSSSSKLPMLSLADNTRNNAVAGLGEFVGTFLFLFFSFAGTQIANTPAPVPSDTPSLPNSSNLLFISLAFGASLMANVWAFYRITGGLFNPSVTIALFLVGGLPALRSAVVIAAQLLGGLAAAGVVSALFPGPMAVDTLLGGGATVVQGLFIEVFLTAELVFVIIMVAVEKHKSTFLAPVAIGVAFFLAELTGVYYTGGSLNLARSLGPAIVNRSFPGYFWIYVVGPGLGSLLASGFYALLRHLRYEGCNPGQDWNDLEKMESQKRDFALRSNARDAAHHANGATNGSVPDGATNGNANGHGHGVLQV